jgi:hypothetical protein
MKKDTSRHKIAQKFPFSDFRVDCKGCVVNNCQARKQMTEFKGYIAGFFNRQNNHDGYGGIHYILLYWPEAPHNHIMLVYHDQAFSKSCPLSAQVPFKIYVDSWDTDPNEIIPFEPVERKKNPRLRSYGTFRNLLEHLILNTVLPPTVHDYIQGIIETMDCNADMPPDDREEEEKDYSFDSQSPKRHLDQYYLL